MKMNRAVAKRIMVPVGARTHEGGKALNPVTLSPGEQLRRLTMAALLWEDSFYVDGKSHADMIAELIPKVSFEELAMLAIDARTKMKLRHMPLLLTVEAMKVHKGRKVADLIFEVIQRPDEITEFVSLYWRNGKRPFAAQMKRGLARATQKFGEYAMAKYNRDAPVKIRDAVFLSHPRARNAEVASMLARMVNKDHIPADIAEKYGLAPGVVGLKSPETWENRLSRGEDKRATFAGMIAAGELGAMAMLRNLRNMVDAGVPDDLIRKGLRDMKAERVLPFRFLAASKFAPRFEPELEAAMFRCLEGAPKLPGKTALLVDVSGSMDWAISTKSAMVRRDAAVGLAMLLREQVETMRVFAFHTDVVEVPPRRGFALRDCIDAVPRGGTQLGNAVKIVNRVAADYDRLIVFTDEQSADVVGAPLRGGYMVNVAAYQNGVGGGDWVKIDGWSESILSYIQLLEGARSVSDWH